MRDQEFQQKITEAFAQTTAAAGKLAIQTVLRDYADCLTNEVNIQFCVDIINAPNSPYSADALQWFLVTLYGAAPKSRLLPAFICARLQLPNSVFLKTKIRTLETDLRLPLLGCAAATRTESDQNFEEAFAFLWESFSEEERAGLLTGNPTLKTMPTFSNYIERTIRSSITSGDFEKLHQLYKNYTQSLDIQTMVMEALNKGDDRFKERFIDLIKNQINKYHLDELRIKTLRSMIVLTIRADIIDDIVIEQEVSLSSNATTAVSLASVLAQSHLGRSLVQAIGDDYRDFLRKKSIEAIYEFLEKSNVPYYYLTHEAAFSVVVEKRDVRLMKFLIALITDLDADGAYVNDYFQRKINGSEETYLASLVNMSPDDFNAVIFFDLIRNNKLNDENLQRLIGLVGKPNFTQVLCDHLAVGDQPNNVVLIGTVIPYLDPQNPRFLSLIERAFKQSNRNQRPLLLNRVIHAYATSPLSADLNFPTIICDQWKVLTNEECRLISLQNISLAHEIKLLETAIEKEHQHCFAQVWQRMSTQHKGEVLGSNSPTSKSDYMIAAIDTHIQNAFYYLDLADASVVASLTEIAACFELYGEAMIARMGQLVINKPRHFISGEGPALCARDLIRLTCYCLDNPSQTWLSPPCVKALVNFTLDHNLLHEQVNIASQPECCLRTSLRRSGETGQSLLQEYDSEYAQKLQRMTDDMLEDFISHEIGKYRLTHPALWEAVIARNKPSLLPLLLTKISRTYPPHHKLDVYFKTEQRMGDEVDAMTPIQRLLTKGHASMVMEFFKLYKPFLGEFLDVMNYTGCDQFARHFQTFAATNPCADLLLQCEHRYIAAVCAEVLPRAFAEIEATDPRYAGLAYFAARLAQNKSIFVPDNREAILAQIGQALMRAPNPFTADWLSAKNEMRLAFYDNTCTQLEPYAHICQHPDDIRRSLLQNPKQPLLEQGLCLNNFLHYFTDKYQKEVLPSGGLQSKDGLRYRERLEHFVALCRYAVSIIPNNDEAGFKRLLAEKITTMARPTGRKVLFFISATKERYNALVDGLKDIPMAILRYRFNEMLVDLMGYNNHPEAFHPIRELAAQLGALVPAGSAVPQAEASPASTTTSVGSTSSFSASPNRAPE